MRFSFVSIEHGDGDPHLVAGEYGDGTRADRAARFTLGGEVELHETGLYRMQGIVIVDGTWYVTTSNGTRRGGDLWVGVPGSFTRQPSRPPTGSRGSRRRPRRAPLVVSERVARPAAGVHDRPPALATARQRLKRVLRSNCAFSATTMVDTDMTAAPTAGGIRKPTPASTPAATGSPIAL